MPNKNIRLDEVVVTAPYNRAALWDMTPDYTTYQLNEFFDKLMNKYRKKRKNTVVTFKSGGKIHINPANRGKFNATKKRTGKTTEELTHSKNPLTRKRAIFAQNAKKWNH